MSRLQNWRKQLFFTFALTLIVSVFGTASAISEESVAIPEPLLPWKDWVLHDVKDAACPFFHNNQNKVCTWVGDTRFNADAQGATFTMNVESFSEERVSIPGSREQWPLDVTYRMNQGPVKTLPVSDANGTPQVQLGKGSYQISGKFQWASMPNYIKLPENRGIVTLRTMGQLKEHADIDRSHYLWLNRKAQNLENQQSDSLSVEVFRLLIDQNPSKIITRILLKVSGQAREVQVAPALLPGYIPLQLSSSLPARIDDNRILRVQVKPGHWNIDVVGRMSTPFNALSFENPSENWPKEELWAFQADRDLRSVQLSGAAPIDPNQTNLPEEWRQFPTYQVSEKQIIKFDEVHRGDPNPEADTLSLNREMYLDFDGHGMTIVDSMSGNLQRSWRLDSSKAYELGSVSQNNQPLLITQSADGESQGVELREKSLQLTAVGRVENYRSMLISGWDINVESLSARLHLPPGWALVGATGVDRAKHSWMSRWSLWNIFLLLITCVAFYRLFGIKLAALAFITLLIIFHRPGAPVFIWLLIASSFALVQVTENKLKRTFVGVTVALFAIMLIQLLPFSIKQIREMIYPQLKHESIRVSSNEYRELKSKSVESPPLAQPAMEMDAQMMEEQSLDHERYEDLPLASLADSAQKPLKRLKKSYSTNVKQTKIDPNAVVQTGPGIPAWNWDSVRLTWSGPVSKSETLQLYLAPPWLTRLGNGVSVILCLLFAAMLIHFGRIISLAKELSPSASSLKTSVVALLLLPVIGGVSERVDAKVNIDAALLEELKSRLTQPPECVPQCFSIVSGHLEIENENLTVSMVVDSQADIAMPLPVFNRVWIPKIIKVNDRQAIVRFNSNGQLLVKLNKGRHTILLAGRPYVKQMDLSFGLPVYNFSYRAPGWDLTGVRKGVVTTGTVQLQKKAKTQEKQETLVPDPIPSFVEVTRTLVFDLEWMVYTQVRRVAPAQGAITVKIPLLKNESPTTNINRENDAAVLVFSANQRMHSWQSVLKKNENIQLEASNSIDYSETWVLQASPIWNVQYDGIPPIKLSQSPHMPTWKPWGGEKVSINVARPSASKGENLTIDNFVMSHSVGLRINETTLSMKVRSSHGQSLEFTLPEGAELDAVSIAGIPQPLAEKNGDISLPLRPGEQSIELTWNDEEGVSWVTTLPRPKLTQNVSNAHLRMKMPRDRWILAVGGPSMGPAVLIWGALVVVLIFSFALSRIPFLPIKFYQWLLLGLGIASTNLISPFIVALWLVVLGLRGWMPRPKRVDHLRMVQVATLLVSIIGIFSLVITIPMGLLSSPDMHIAGNGSGAFMMRWYQDIVSGELPNAWVLSVPMIFYRIAMLLWSLWLAVTLLQWLKWGWLQLNAHGFWHLKGEEDLIQK